VNNQSVTPSPETKLTTTPPAAKKVEPAPSHRHVKRKRGLKALLLRKEAPFLLAALAAILCWLVNHISSRLLEARLISFSEDVDRPRPDGTQRITYTIKNLTRTVVFTNLGFVIDVEENADHRSGSIFGNERHKYVPESLKKFRPTFVPDRLTRKLGFDWKFPDENDTTLECTISQFHPQRQATLTLYVKAGTDAPLRFRIEEPPSRASKQIVQATKQGEAADRSKSDETGDVLPVLFEKTSPWTLAVEYEFPLTMLFAIFLIVCIVLYAKFLIRNPEEEKTENKP
jgi:hypothetical protein